MISAFRQLSLALFILIQALQSLCNYPDWYEGDWVMENLKGTDEAIGVTGDWADYVYTLGGEYDENPVKSTTEFVTGPAGAQDWYPLSPNEIPYLAVLYRRDKGPSLSYSNIFGPEAVTKHSHVEPGTACGGVLLTPKLVLSVCGCLSTVIANIQDMFSPSQSDPKFFNPYDIFDGQPPFQRIYVTHSSIEFSPNYEFEVEQDKNKWPQEGALNCKDLLTLLNDANWNRGVRDDAKKAEFLNTQLILVPIKQEIKPKSTEFFPPWPPRILNYIVDPAYLQQVDIISFGMRFSKPPGRKFFSDVSASSIEMKHCPAPEPSFTCNNSRVARSENYTCFCPLPGVGYNLYGGTIGWPIVQGNELVGLSASARNPRDGLVAAVMLSDKLIGLIGRFVGKEVLTDQNTSPPLYRDNDLGKSFFVYDYGSFRSRRKYYSKAAALHSKILLIFFSFTSWIGASFK